MSMKIKSKKTFFIAILVMILAAGLLIKAGLLRAVMSYIQTQYRELLDCHYTSLQIYFIKNGKWFYYLLPDGMYNAGMCVNPLSTGIILAMTGNALFNALFQPIFPCVFSPQAMLNYILFPFFLYGAVKYFRKLWFMIILFFCWYIYSGLYGCVIEALIRHRMPCELIYLLLGLAGFTDWITKKSSS